MTINKPVDYLVATIIDLLRLIYPDNFASMDHGDAIRYSTRTIYVMCDCYCGCTQPFDAFNY